MDLTSPPQDQEFSESRIEELRARHEELKPFVEEAEAIGRLLRAWDDLESRAPRPWRRTTRPRKAYPTAVRREQIRQVLEEAPEIRRAEIGRRLGISRARAGQLVNMLIQDDIVAEDGRGRLWLREGE